MITFLAVAFAVLLLSMLIRRYRVRERRKDLLIMKRHAAMYYDQGEQRLAG